MLLPDCYRGFHDGWLTEIQQLMLTHKSLYYSVLACAASHMFLGDSVCEMHYIALSYYSQGVKELSLLLSNVSEYENHDALLMSVILLYLYGVCFRKRFFGELLLTGKVFGIGHTK